MNWKNIFLTGFIVINVYSFQAQGINYQGVARNANGAVLANQALGIRISIIADAPTGTVLFTESHIVTTNAFGLYNLVIGSGIATTGVFSDINWNSFERFVKVEIDPTGGTSYTDMGTTKLQSVPFALAAHSANNLRITGTNQDMLLHNGTQWRASPTPLVDEGLDKLKLHTSKNELIFGDVRKINSYTSISNSLQPINNPHDMLYPTRPIVALNSSKITASSSAPTFSTVYSAFDSTTNNGSAYFGRSISGPAYLAANSPYGFLSTSSANNSIGTQVLLSGNYSNGQVIVSGGQNSIGIRNETRGNGSAGYYATVLDSAVRGIYLVMKPRTKNTSAIDVIVAEDERDGGLDSVLGIKSEVRHGTNTASIYGINSSISAGNIGVKGECTASGYGVFGSTPSTGSGVGGSSPNGTGVVGYGIVGLKAIENSSNSTAVALELQGGVRALGDKFAYTTTPLSAPTNIISLSYSGASSTDVLMVTQATNDALVTSPAQKIYWSSATSNWNITSVNGSNFPIGTFFNISIFKK